MSCLTGCWIVISPGIVIILGDLTGSESLGFIHPIHQHVIKLHAAGEIPYIEVKLRLPVLGLLNLKTIAIFNGKERMDKPGERVDMRSFGMTSFRK